MKKIKFKVLISLAVLLLANGCSNKVRTPDGTHMRDVNGDTSHLCIYESRVYNLGSQVISAGFLHECVSSEEDVTGKAAWKVVV